RKILQVERQIGEDQRTAFKEWCDQHRLFILTTMKQMKRQIQNQYAVIYVPEYLHLHNIFVKMELFSADRHCLSEEIIQLSRDCYGERPLGFTNATGICCWMNATLQVLLNFPQVREKIRKRAGLIETSEEKYRSDFEAGIKLLERLKNKKTDENDKQKLMTQIEQKRKELDDQVRLEVRRDAVLARALLPLLAYPTDQSKVDGKTIKSFHDILFSSHLNFYNAQTAENQQNDAQEGVNYILDRLDMKFPFVQESIPESGNIRERKTETSALMIQDFKPTLQASIDNLFVEDKHNPKEPEAKSRRSQGRTVIKAKRFKIDGEPPELMVVHLNRVHYDERANQIRYDKEMLFSNKSDEDLIFDFSAGFRDGKTHRYRLEAYTSQSGGVSGGHYTAYVHRGKKWYCANDSTIREVSPPEKVDKSFYSMVFKRVSENG
ncbi:MAG: ubiquitin carboxyl-terminal hydrolase, partial [Chlamydiia bacterium]|nr:ubiquitin carboxyl-terminal hydrolase [Chlamydiia bacterium]